MHRIKGTSSEAARLSKFRERILRRKQVAARKLKIAEAKRRKKRAPGLTTRRLLQHAAHGSESAPVGDVMHDLLFISYAELAKRTCAAARAFKKFPRFAALKVRPLPDRGDGPEFGLRLFRFAATAPSRMVTSILAKGDHPGTENDLWMMLRQLYRYFDGVAWAPPLLSASVHSHQKHRPPPIPKLPQPVEAKRPPLTSALEAIWNALNKRSFSCKDLRKHLEAQGNHVSVDAIRKSISRLKRLKYPVERSTRHGYYRPDAPPE